MRWDKLLSAMYARTLSDDEFEVWEELLADYKPTNHELCGAIKRASALGLKTRQYRATTPDLILWLKEYRCEKSGGVVGAR